VRVLQWQGQLVPGAGVQINAKNKEKVVKFGAVNYAKAIKLVDTGNGVLVLELGQPSVGNVEFFVLLALGDSPAEFFYFSCSYAEAIAKLS